MRSPHYFLHGNLVFAEGRHDVWAAYRLDGESYPGLSAGRKVELKERTELFAYEVESDFSVIRTARSWSADAYVARALSTLDPRQGHRETFEAYLAEQRVELARRRVLRPEVYLLIRLGGPARKSGAGEAASALWRRAAGGLGLSDARGMGPKELEELRGAEERAFDRTYAHLPCERARSDQLAALIRGAYVRGVGEPRMDANWRPQAVWVDSEDGAARWEPYEYDLLRLHDARVEIERRVLRIDSDELGEAYQALLVVGGLPDQAVFPGREAELMFAPLEVGFPVDAVFSCEFVSNRDARKLAQKGKVDADQQAKEESYGEHGPSADSRERPYQARELEDLLSASDRPPLLRSALTLCVGAGTRKELDRRVERLRAEFGRIELHQPLGEQHRLFMASLPARRFPLPEYKQHLLGNQFGAMVPTAISHAGSDVGPVIGYTLSGSRQPVQYDVAEACQEKRPPTVLFSGSLGSGKTIALEQQLYHAYLQGSAPIVEIDPKGDHRLHLLPELEGTVERIELGPEETYQGLLDPMRIGADDLREDLTYTFLIGILPNPVLAEWQTEIRAAVAEANARECGCTEEVLRVLAAGNEAAQGAARALGIHLSAGLARLGYGRVGGEVAEVGGRQVISLHIGNLVLPAPATPRAEYQEDERVSHAVLQLCAAYAMRLCAATTDTHSVMAADEAWVLTSSAQGRAMLGRFSRAGRAMNITPLLASQMLADAEELEPLVGSYFAFGVETESEAREALKLLRLDVDDRVLIERMLGFRQGRCYFRDLDGRVVPMQIDPSEELLKRLDTTPKREAESSRRGEDERSDAAVAV